MLSEFAFVDILDKLRLKLHDFFVKKNSETETVLINMFNFLIDNNSVVFGESFPTNKHY